MWNQFNVVMKQSTMFEYSTNMQMSIKLFVYVPKHKTKCDILTLTSS